MTRIIFMTAALVFASVSIASAECAWVLWIKREVNYYYADKRVEKDTRWELQTAWKTQGECEKVKEKIWALEANQYHDLKGGIEKVEKVPSEAVFLTLKPTKEMPNGYHNAYFQCYPDTIDPRAPKR